MHTPNTHATLHKHAPPGLSSVSKFMGSLVDFDILWSLTLSVLGRRPPYCPTFLVPETPAEPADSLRVRVENPVTMFAAFSAMLIALCELAVSNNQ